MSDSKVLALKYRPKRFEDLVGQDTISQTLSLALDSNRLSHAYLFSGLRGSGKTSTARIMAKALLCDKGPTSKPCEVCNNCVNANANRHLDVIEMDAASNRGIDDIKDLIEHTKYKPSSARFKVFIIDEVHMLTTQAFNALLKTLEEPPGFVKFILATTDPLKLPATILSRTQHFRFKKISQKDVVHHLSHILNIEEIEFESTALDIITRAGNGSLRDTLTLLDQAIIYAKGKIDVTSVTDMLGLVDPSFMDRIFDTILQKANTKEIIKELDSYEASEVVDEMILYLKERMLESDPKFDTLLFDRYFRILSDAKHLLSINADSGFVFILTISKLIEASNLKSIDEIIHEVEQIHESESVVKRVTPIKSSSTPVLKDEVVDKNIDTELSKLPQQETKKIKDVVEKEPIKELRSEPKEEVATLSVENSSKTLEFVDGYIPFEQIMLEYDGGETIDSSESREELALDNSVNSNIEPNMESNTIVDSGVNLNIDLSTAQIEPPIEEEAPLNRDDEIHKEMYAEVISRVYERSHDLGECVERNFFFDSFVDNKLYIKSFADGEDKKRLWKNFAIIRHYIESVFGLEIDIEFKKLQDKKETKRVEPKKDEIVESINEQSATKSEVDTNEPPLSQIEPKEEETEVEEVISDEQEAVGAGCVADMTNTSNPNEAQKDLPIKDVIESKMVQKAIEVFDVKKVNVKSKM